MLVVERVNPGAECRMLGFETLTIPPIDRTLIDTALHTVEERGRVYAYHTQVADTLGRIWMVQRGID